jgi:hypothetical protein
MGTMFLPNDLSNDEKDLVAQVYRQLVASEPEPVNDRARQAQRHRAEEIAAEMIHQGRSSTSSRSTEADLDPSGPPPLEDGIRTELQMLEEDQADLEAEREQEYQEYLAAQRPQQ